MTGSGTVGDPYIIYDVTDLQAMENDVTAYYELANDINATITNTWNGGLGFDPIYNFSGSLDGKGYIIDNLTIARGASNSIGLFSVINGGTLSNIGLTNCSITGNLAVGAFADSIDNGATITSCYATGSVNGATYVGGLIGLNYAGTTIRKCYSTCTVTGGAPAGGFTGSCQGSVYDSYARGAVSGTSAIGGFTGYNWVGGIIDNCYSTGLVTSPLSKGGLCGSLAGGGGTVTDSFWDTETSGIDTSYGGIGKTTAEMKTAATFWAAGWAIAEIWNLFASCNDGYPCLIDVNPCCPVSVGGSVDATIIGQKVSLEAIRNIEMVYGGRFYIDKSGNAVYESRYHRNV